MVVARGWREEGMGSYCVMGTEFQFCKMKNVLWVDVVMAAEQYECAQCH